MWNGAETKIELILIRHGKTKANGEHRYLGKTDEALSTFGKEQLQRRKKQQVYPECEVVFASPMKRCIETAEILYPHHNVKKIKEWEEIDFGAFEGKNYLELQEDERYQEWMASNGTLPFPGGESREEFVERCKLGWEIMTRTLLDYGKEPGGGRVAVVVHGGTIMALLSVLAGGAYFDYQVANGEGYICTATVVEQQLKLIDIRKLQ